MMMRQLILDNYCQYDHAVLDFTPGVNMVVGRNGSGKSNSVKAAYAAVTNDFGRNAGNKFDNVRGTAAEGDRARIRLVFTHNDVTLDVMRNLRKGKDALTATNSAGEVIKQLQGSEQVTEYIMGLLGVSPKLLGDYVFVDQGAMFAFLSMSPGDRSKAFQRLFGIEQASALYDMLTRRVSREEVPSAGQSRDVLNTQMVEAERTCKEVESQLAEYLHADENYHAADDEVRQAIVREWDERVKLMAEGRLVSQQLERYKDELQPLDARMAAANESIAKLQDYIDEEYNNANAWLGMLATWQEYHRTQALRDKQEQFAAQLEQSIVAYSAQTTVPEGYVAVDKRKEFHEVWETTRLLLADARQFLGRALFKDGGIVCPTCGTRQDHLLTMAEEKRVIADHAATHDDIMRVQWQCTNDYDREEAARLHKLGDTQALLAQYRSQLAELPAVVAPDASEAELRERVRVYEEVQAALSGARRTLQRDEIDVARLRGHVEAGNNRLHDLRHKLAMNTSVEGEAEAAQKDMQDCEARANEKRALLARRETAETACTRIRDLLESLQVVEVEADATRSWITHARDLQAAVHYNALPKIMAQTQLELLEEEINEVLEQFDSDFRVRADEGLTFVADFWKGKKVGASQTAGRLSWGEKTVLAVAFRVAVNSIFAKDLGLLVLDEPTAGLDEVNLDCLRVAFQRLAAVSRERGLQVVLVTHEKNLPPGNNLIEIGAEA